MSKTKDDFYDMMSMKWLGVDKQFPDSTHGEHIKVSYPEGSNQAEMADAELTWSQKGLSKPNPETRDHINPSHYKGIVGNYQYIECMEFILGYDGLKAHLLGQIYKYLMRMGKKDNELQETRKVVWYTCCLEILQRDGTIIGRLGELSE